MTSKTPTLEPLSRHEETSARSRTRAGRERKTLDRDLERERQEIHESDEARAWRRRRNERVHEAMRE